MRYYNVYIYSGVLYCVVWNIYVGTFFGMHWSCTRGTEEVRLVLVIIFSVLGIAEKFK